MSHRVKLPEPNETQPVSNYGGGLVYAVVIIILATVIILAGLKR